MMKSSKFRKGFAVLGLTGLAGLGLSGCMTQERAERILDEIPTYARENVGEVKVGGLDPRLLVTWGYVSRRDPNATIHVSPLATKGVVLHEAGHSFESRESSRDKEAFENFYLEFEKGGRSEGSKYTGLAIELLMMFSEINGIPIGWVPVPGEVSLRGCVNHPESFAEFFKAVSLGEKRKDDFKYTWKFNRARDFMHGLNSRKSGGNVGGYLENELKVGGSDTDDVVFVRRYLGRIYDLGDRGEEVGSRSVGGVVEEVLGK